MPLPKRYAVPRKTVNRAPNKLTDLANATIPRTGKAGPKNSNGPTGGSSKSSVKVTTKIPGTKFSKLASVTKAKLNTVPKTPFNRSKRVNYAQLRRSK